MYSYPTQQLKKKRKNVKRRKTTPMEPRDVLTIL
jgi:hypothetical protein